MNTTINIYLKREQLYIVLLFLFSGGKMTKELQSSRYIVISYGIELREHYNKSKKEKQIIPQCTPEKEEAIMDALRHFKMI